MSYFNTNELHLVIHIRKHNDRSESAIFFPRRVQAFWSVCRFDVLSFRTVQFRHCAVSLRAILSRAVLTLCCFGALLFWRRAILTHSSFDRAFCSRIISSSAVLSHSRNWDCKARCLSPEQAYNFFTYFNCTFMCPRRATVGALQLHFVCRKSALSWCQILVKIINTKV